MEHFLAIAQETTVFFGHRINPRTSDPSNWISTSPERVLSFYWLLLLNLLAPIKTKCCTNKPTRILHSAEGIGIARTRRGIIIFAGGFNLDFRRHDCSE